MIDYGNAYLVTNHNDKILQKFVSPEKDVPLNCYSDIPTFCATLDLFILRDKKITTDKELKTLRTYITNKVAKSAPAVALEYWEKYLKKETM